MTLFGKKRIYLDWAAAAPVSPAAARAFGRALCAYGNPSSPHAEGVAAQKELEEARVVIAKLMEVKRDGVVFTSGATEANNLALSGHVARLRADGVAAQDMHILYLPSAHASVVETLTSLARSGVSTEALTLSNGTLDLADLEQKLRPTTRLVVLDAVCGETGMRYPTRAVRNLLDSARQRAEAASARILLHVDASQLPLAAPFDLTRLAADSVTLDAQKVGGIRGVGALCMRSHVRLAPVLAGGGQEHGLRPGTEPVALAAAFAAALAEASKGSSAFTARAQRMRERLLARLQEGSLIPGLLVNEGKEQVPHILNLSLLGRDTDYLVMLLDRAGFSVATKSACESESASGSRAVLALIGDQARAKATLRISWGPTTHERDLDCLADALSTAVAFLDANSLAA
jgi:cysteine desulfurase